MNKLTNQSKRMALASIVVALCVIGASLLFIIQNTRPQSSAAAGVTIAVILIAAAFFTALAYIILRMYKCKHAKKLNNDYYQAYEKISDALNDRILSNHERKEVLADILDLFLQAQRDNRPASDVISNNIEQFLNEIRLAYGNKSRLLYSVLNGIVYSMIMIFLVQGISYIEHMQTIHFFETKIDISTFTFLLPLTLVVLPWARSFMGKNKTGLMILLPLIYSALVIGLFTLLRKTAYDILWVHTLLDGRISVISSWEVLILWLAAILGIEAILIFSKRNSIKNP